MQLKTTHVPAEQPTPAAPRILVQSRPSPVEAQPPHESSASVVSMHSSASLGRSARGRRRRRREGEDERRTATRATHHRRGLDGRELLDGALERRRADDRARRLAGRAERLGLGDLVLLDARLARRAEHAAAGVEDVASRAARDDALALRARALRTRGRELADVVERAAAVRGASAAARRELDEEKRERTHQLFGSLVKSNDLHEPPTSDMPDEHDVARQTPDEQICELAPVTAHLLPIEPLRGRSERRGRQPWSGEGGRGGQSGEDAPVARVARDVAAKVVGRVERVARLARGRADAVVAGRRAAVGIGGRAGVADLAAAGAEERRSERLFSSMRKRCRRGTDQLLMSLWRLICEHCPLRSV